MFKTAYAGVLLPACFDRLRLRLIFLLVSFVWVGASTSLAIPVEVSIHSDKGPPVPKALVTIVRSATDTVAANQSTMYKNVTDAAGKLTVDVPGPGNYFICAGSAEAELLDSCLWPNSTAAFSVPDPASANAPKKLSVKVSLQSGVTLRLHVADPNGLVPTSASPTRSGFLQAGVWSGGRFRFARLTSFNNADLNYEMVVPINGDLHISFQAFGLKVLDENGVPVDPKNATISFQTQSNESSKVRNFSVVPAN